MTMPGRSLVALCSFLFLSTAVQAAEGGAGAYLLGLRASGAGTTAPPGVYVSNHVFIYSGDIAGRLPTEGGLLPASAEANVAVDIPTLLWVTPFEVLGGRLGVSATTPVGRLELSGRVGPIELEDSSATFSDPILTAFLGWRQGPLHLQLGASGYMPWGDYQKGALANIAKHRLALDLYGAATILDAATGIDVTNVVGLTLNAENEATNYKTGNELHWEWAISKKWQDGISVGVIGYVYHQLTGDSGPGAVLGDFKGRAAAVGATFGYDFKFGALPVSTRARFYHEFAVENRLQGEAFFLSASMPLWVGK